MDPGAIWMWRSPWTTGFAAPIQEGSSGGADVVDREVAGRLRYRSERDDIDGFAELLRCLQPHAEGDACFAAS